MNIQPRIPALFAGLTSVFLSLPHSLTAQTAQTSMALPGPQDPEWVNTSPSLPPSERPEGTPADSKKEGGTDKKKDGGKKKKDNRIKRLDPSDNKRKEPYMFAPLTWGGPEGDDYKLFYGGENRTRFESRNDFGGILDTEDDDNLGFIRTRVHGDLLYRDVVRAYVEILDGREVDPNYQYLQEAHFNLQQAFLELRNINETSWSLRLGRQEIKLGRDRRLVNASGFSNLRRSFQGARAMYQSKEMDVDLFLLNTLPFERERNGQRYTSRARLNEDEYFYGAWATLRQWDPHTIETFFLGLSDQEEDTMSENRVPGTSDRYTIGSNIYGPLCKQEEVGTLGYLLGGAYQFGHRSEDQIRAYMLRGNLWYEWEHDWEPRLTLEAVLASGDRERGDGENNTFSPLFGSTHTPYGIIDAVRLQNLRDLSLFYNVKPTEKLKLQFGLHAFWLDSKTDAWYEGSGDALGRDLEGDSGRSIGREIDFVGTYKCSDWLTYEAGAAYFFPGSTAREFGKEDGAAWVYLQTVFTF